MERLKITSLVLAVLFLFGSERLWAQVNGGGKGLSLLEDENYSAFMESFPLLTLKHPREFLPRGITLQQIFANSLADAPVLEGDGQITPSRFSNTCEAKDQRTSKCTLFVNHTFFYYQTEASQDGKRVLKVRQIDIQYGHD